MGKLIFNLVHGEKYGDANDPKTRWSTHGVMMIDDSADQADLDAFSRLVENRKISMRVESMPTSKFFDGWFSIFKREPRDGAAAAGEHAATDNVDDKPIDLSEIPF
jgi:hypothetical protein